ncbi:MAG: type II toxin-antitoxin system VapC family toxin [Sandarakinorhabdus sp.]|nr:type II toxin-antitoxin system VapC family toxin [Sandarakinorhabdus sp.]
MKILLDTHAAIWWWTESPRLGKRVTDLLAGGETPIYVSAVTALEIAIKFRIGKLLDFGDPAADFPALMASNGFESLPISQSHALAAGLLPGNHRDPFDRLIAAQALSERLTVATCDGEFASFGCKTIW